MVVNAGIQHVLDRVCAAGAFLPGGSTIICMVDLEQDRASKTRKPEQNTAQNRHGEQEPFFSSDGSEELIEWGSACPSARAAAASCADWSRVLVRAFGVARGS